MDQSEKGKFLEAFGSRVKQLRTERKLSQEGLANLVGYTSDNARSSINKIESGKSDLPASKIRSFANALNVSVSQLMAWDEEFNQDNKIASKVEIIELISARYNENSAYAFSEFIKLEDAEAKKIVKLISMYGKMDEMDRAEVRGYIFSKIEDILNTDKYKEKGSSNGKVI